MSEANPLKICIQRVETRSEWDKMQADYIQQALYAVREIERLRKALDFYHCGCAEGTCNVTRPKFKGIKCGMTARKALEGKDD